MERTLIKDLHDHIEKEITIEAWVDVARNQGKMAFFDFRDRSGNVQGVVFGKPEVLETAKTLKSEWVVRISGIVNKRPEKMIKESAQNGDIEIEITGIDILAEAQELPFDMDADLNIDTLFDYRPLTLRRAKDKAIFTVQHEIIRAYREFLTTEDFVEFQAPKLVGGDAEGGSEVFKFEYFKNQDAFLATSPQLYKQILVGVFERVFTTGNVYRAEKHATSRHLNEYTSLDVEFGFITDHTDVMRLLTRLMQYTTKHLQEHCEKEFKLLESTLPDVPEGEMFPHMKLKEALELIKEKTGNDKTKASDLDPEDERWLCEYAQKEFNSDFIFITHYPVSKRPFYTYEDENDAGYTKSFDLLFRGVEITTGGQRVHLAATMEEKIREKGIDPEQFSFYLQAFRYGMPPHGGWGMGLERLTQKFLGLQNTKEASAFPRDINRIDVRLSEEKNNND